MAREKNGLGKAVKYCTIDGLELCDKTLCVVEDKAFSESDCSHLIALKRKGRTHLNCEFYKEYKAPVKPNKKELLALLTRVKGLFEKVKDKVLEKDVAEMIARLEK